MNITRDVVASNNRSKKSLIFNNFGLKNIVEAVEMSFELMTLPPYLQVVMKFAHFFKAPLN